MNVELLTKQDLHELKEEILSQLNNLLKSKTDQKEWLKSSDVRKLLNISSGTLQHLRVSGLDRLAFFEPIFAYSLNNAFEKTSMHYFSNLRSSAVNIFNEFILVKSRLRTPANLGEIRERLKGQMIWK